MSIERAAHTLSIDNSSLETFVAAVLVRSSLGPHVVGTKRSGLGVALPTKGAFDTQPCVFVHGQGKQQT
jgi:hypothetical protein